ncbi:unnamed protein product [Paramecium octaurelia]|uniref:Uncharacterized protein n=1 Tax=Paramecium octaurelia TaxID=43137 RepID=A0A8S1TTE5_PAROT|nr:unnamed protein product [Paramecium octaurelia]
MQTNENELQQSYKKVLLNNFQELPLQLALLDIKNHQIFRLITIINLSYAYNPKFNMNLQFKYTQSQLVISIQS